MDLAWLPERVAAVGRRNLQCSVLLVAACLWRLEIVGLSLVCGKVSVSSLRHRPNLLFRVVGVDLLQVLPTSDGRLLHSRPVNVVSDEGGVSEVSECWRRRGLTPVSEADSSAKTDGSLL